MRLLPDIGFGTRIYPETVARRLRATNVVAWLSCGLVGIFAIRRLAALSPETWELAAINCAATLAMGALPLLHRFGSRAAASGFFVTAVFTLVSQGYLIGTATGVQFHLLAVAALSFLLFGADRPLLAWSAVAVSAASVLVLEFDAPRMTGVLPSSDIGTSFAINLIADFGIVSAVVWYALAEADRAQRLSDSLLHNILPVKIAERLKAPGRAAIIDRYDAASVLVADMAGFTTRAAETEPIQLVGFLNEVFSSFDRLVAEFGLEKIKTTGDAYMVVSGVPEPRPDHAEILADFALALAASAAGLRDPHGEAMGMRIGIASGPVVAGVVGTRKFFYDIWGETVNLAARMESTGVPGRVQLAGAMHGQLAPGFAMEDRGTIQVKGMGPMPTWFLLARAEAGTGQRRAQA